MVKLKVLSEKQVYKKPELVMELIRLTLHTYSGLHCDLLGQRAGNYILAYDGPTIIGWGLVSENRRTLDYQVSIFVRPEFRRQGIGTKIASKAKQIAKKKEKGLTAHRWSDEAFDFFVSNEINHAYYDFLDIPAQSA